MPGRYEHIITLDLHIEPIDTINLPGEFQDVADGVNKNIETLNSNLEQIEPTLLTAVAERSQQLQRQSLLDYDSFITGKLYNSISQTIASGTASIGTDLFYAEYVNDGRGPVHAKNAKALHFITKDGVEHFVKSVKAAKPNPYLEDSNEDLSEDITQLLNEILGALL